MDDLRRDVIETFDKGQSELGDLRGVRERMLRGAYAGRTNRSVNRLQLAAGIAAILIAALVIATFVYVRAGSQLSPAGGLNVPDSTPLILFHDPANDAQIDGITWDGRSLGRVGDGGVDGGTSNPAGTLYATGTDIRDRRGRVVGPLANTPVSASRVRWADDELHYCQVAPAPYKGVGPGPGMLQLVLPGGQPTNVAQVGIFPPASQDQPPPFVSACSVQNDRAVIGQGAGTSNLTFKDWVVQLSTGRILWTHTITMSGEPSAVGIIATHDGLFVSESIALPPPGRSTIFGPDGKEVARVAGTVYAFSWDGSLAVITVDSTPEVRLIQWRTGNVVWSAPIGLHFRTARSEPGGTRVAIGLIDNPDNTNPVWNVYLYVVSAGGHVDWIKNDVNLA